MVAGGRCARGRSWGPGAGCPVWGAGPGWDNLLLLNTREWRNRQTRTVQVRVPERAWGFNSPLAHLKLGFSPVATSGRYEAA